MVVRPLSKELQELAIEKLNEDPNKIKDHIKHIREWSKTLPHLKIRTDDQWILSFLRACKFNLDLVKRKLEYLYTMKLQTPEWFTNRDPFLPEIQEVLKLGVCLPLPNTSDPAAPRVIFYRDCAETLNFPLDERIKLSFMFLELLLYEDDNYVIAGYHFLTDNKNVGFRHIYQAQPGIMQKGYNIIAKGYATRPKGFYGINVPWVARIAFDTLKYYAPERLLNIIHIYENKNIHKLYDTIPISLLPKEYGGDGGSIEELTLKWKAKIEDYRDWFMEEDRYQYEKQETESDDDDDDDCYEDAECFEDQEYDEKCDRHKENCEEADSTNSITTFEEFLGLGGLVG